MTGGVDTLHIRFGEGVRRVEFSFKKITLTDIGDVHPARVDLSEPAQSTTPDQGDETTPPSSSPRRTTHEQGDKTTPPSSSPRRTTHDHAETSRVSWTSSSTSVVDGTSVHESSTGEITLTPTAVLIISSVLSFVVVFGLCLCLCFCRRCRGSPPPPRDIEMNYHHLPLSGEGDGDSVVSDMSDVVFHRAKND
ncbi:uncharacterized protein LOC128155886 isoform X1 [Crassostrea angulata]|nr:uncharacterized protein LOC128155886 isoform X1 [Crassostrea angulata]